MKRVAIVTLYYMNFNFGGQLQAYALQNYISNLGFECEVISYNSQNKFKKIKCLTPKILFSRFFHKFQMKYHTMLNPRLRKSFNKKAVLFTRFMKSIPHTSEVHNDDIEKISSLYDYWITGSDQVWNPEIFVGSPLYLLKYINGKKISYAASSNNAQYKTEQASEIKSSLKSFSAISVREKGLEKAISSITKRSVSTVLDPTLLLEEKNWNRVAVLPTVKKKYAFVYLIHISDEVRKNIFEFCHSNNLTMIIVPHAQGWYKTADEKYYDKQAAAIGPAEWIGYIKNAEIVLTDSYHGTIFSMIYHKQFLSFENVSGDPHKDEGLRKYSILNQLGVSDRCIPYSFDLNCDLPFAPIDYERVDSKLKILREKSSCFLKNALDIEE